MNHRITFNLFIFRTEITKFSAFKSAPLNQRLQAAPLAQHGYKYQRLGIGTPCQRHRISATKLAPLFSATKLVAPT